VDPYIDPPVRSIVVTIYDYCGDGAFLWVHL